MLLAAGRAAPGALAGPGIAGIRIGTGSLELDVAVEPSKQASQPTSGSAGPSTRAKPRPSRRDPPSALLHEPSTATPQSSRCRRSLRRGVMQRLVERGCDWSPGGRRARRSARRSAQGRRGRFADAASDLVDRVVDASISRALLELGLRPDVGARERRPRLGLERSSRPCQARFLSFTAASSSANLYAHVVKRLAPRKSPSRRRTLTSASSAAWLREVVEVVAAQMRERRPSPRNLEARRLQEERVQPGDRLVVHRAVGASERSHSRDSGSSIGSDRASFDPARPAAPRRTP